MDGEPVLQAHDDGVRKRTSVGVAARRRHGLPAALVLAVAGLVPIAALVPIPGLAPTAVPLDDAAAELRATPANLQKVFAAARAGDTILLASGDYGEFRGGMKDGMVTLRPDSYATARMDLSFQPAANVTIDGVALGDVDIGDAQTQNIVVRNADVTGQVTLLTGELQNANIVLDRNVHRDWTKCEGCAEGRVWLPENTDQPTGITIANSEFRGGESDGILNGSNGTRILNNVFHGLIQGDPDFVHTDAIQLFGSRNTVIRGNYFYDVPSGIMAPDGADHEVIEDNVFAGDPDGYPFAITLWSDDGSIVRHNTLADGGCAFGVRCGILSLGSKEDRPAGRGTTITDNVLGEISVPNGSASVALRSHNLLGTGGIRGAWEESGVPGYVGGAMPSSYAGHALARRSLGKRSASDGQDRGARIGGR